MAHERWCGKPCSECVQRCPLDEALYCSPDCSNLKLDGSPNVDECRTAGCDALAAMLEDQILSK